MDSAARGFAQKIISELGKIIYRLDELRATVREQPKKPEPNKDNAGKEGPSGDPAVLDSVGVTPTKGRNSENHADDAGPKWDKWLKRVGVGAGIGYAVVTFCMWLDIRNNFILDERPYIVISRTQFTADPTLALPKNISVDIYFKNIGKTLANRVTVYRRLAILYGMMSENNAEREKIFSLARQEAIAHRFDTSMAPSEEKFMSTLNPVTLTPEDLTKITGERAAILLVGGVMYEDIFGNLHETELCLFRHRSKPERLASM